MKEILGNALRAANGAVLSFIYCAGEMRGGKQRTQLPVFLPQGLYRRGTEAGDRGQGRHNEKGYPLHGAVLHCYVNLPDGEGFSLFRALRAKADVPALFLSARDADADRLFGLGLGADVYDLFIYNLLFNTY